MSGVRSLALVAGRELRQAFLGKAFWIVSGLLFAASAAAMIVPELTKAETPHYKVAVVAATPTFEATIKAGADNIHARIALEPVADIAEARRQVDAGDVDVAAVAGDHPLVVVKSIGLVQQALGLDTVVARLEAAGLSPSQIQGVLATPPVRVEYRDAGETERTRRGVAFGVSFALYMLLILLMAQVANGTATEKSNRISEVLLAIVRPRYLLFGKVAGVGLLGLLTILAGVVPILGKLAIGGDLPEGIGAALGAGAAWYLLGIALYLILAGASGALVERPEEASSAVMPINIALVGGLLASQAPDSALAHILAFVPLTSPLVMPSRIAIGAASGLEMAGSLALLVLAVAAAGRVGATVYRRAIVRTGRRLKLREVLSA
jgi:ABC-2 type transport system permease protein